MRTGLVYHIGALGDLVVAVPTVERWAHDLKVSRLILLGHEHFGDLLKVTAIVDDCWDASAAWFSSAYRGARPVLPELVDTVLAFTAPGGPIEQALITAVSGPVTVVPPVPAAREPIIQHHLRAIGAKPMDSSRPTLAIPKTSRTGQRIAIAPGSGSKLKNWPLDRFRIVAEVLRPKATVMWLLGPAEEHLCPPADNSDLIVRGQPIKCTAQEISSCTLLVGNDSGLCHLGAALGVPVVVMFAVTDAAVWAPAPTSSSVLVVTPSSVIPADNCTALPEPSDSTSMDDISVDLVISAALSLLE